MDWIAIDATAPGSLVVILTHGLDLHVHRRVAELIERRTGRCIAAWILPRA